MEKNIRESLLLDYYGELLTSRQREVMRLYLNKDISLSEIADELKTTRQAVYDIVKTSTALLEDFEKKLKKVESSLIIRNSLEMLDSLETSENSFIMKKIKSELEKVINN